MIGHYFDHEVFRKRDHFVIEPETVADAIVKQLHSGMGAHLVLPERYWGATTVEAWPSWAQKAILNGTGNEYKFLGSKGKFQKDPDVEGFSYHF